MDLLSSAQPYVSCPICRASNPAIARYCTSCGTPLTNVSTPAPMPPGLSSQAPASTPSGLVSNNPSIPIIEASDLVKYYDMVAALSGLNLRVMPGEIYGLLGPNGAGKSTTIKLITGLTEPTSGHIRVLGRDPTADPIGVKSILGYVSENPILYDSLSPREFFEFVASIRKIDPRTAYDRVVRLVRAFDMAQYYDSPIATLSMGTKQKVSIIAALMHEPPVLLLDEPLNGLDAKSSRILKDLLSFHTQNNKGCVLFSTHIMEVAEHICDRIGIIYQGRIVAEGSLDDLRGKAGGGAEAGKATLEEVFLRLTNEEQEIAETVQTLRQAFSK